MFFWSCLISENIYTLHLAAPLGQGQIAISNREQVSALTAAGGAEEQVEPGPQCSLPHIPHSLYLWGLAWELGRKQPRAAEHNLGQPHGVCN